MDLLSNRLHPDILNPSDLARILTSTAFAQQARDMTVNLSPTIDDALATALVAAEVVALFLGKNSISVAPMTRSTRNYHSTSDYGATNGWTDKSRPMSSPAMSTHMYPSWLDVSTNIETALPLPTRHRLW